MREVICAKCGKLFFPAPQHALVDENGMYCKPTCFLHRERNTNVDGRTRKARAVVMCDQDGKEVASFRSATNAAEELGADYKGIQVACRDGSTYLGYLWKYEV